jgi:5-formyltetrahydrofolate cyclo-ligase
MYESQYFVLPGRYNSGNILLIKFDGNRQYSYWDRKNKTWIPGTTIFEEHWLNGYLRPVTEKAGKRMIEKGVKNASHNPLQMRDLKNSIRQILRQRRDSMTPEERLDKSRRICNHFLDLIPYGETVLAYTSKEKEVNTREIITTLLERGNPVVVPIIVKEDRSLRLSFIRDLSSLVPSTFGVPEPTGSETPAMGAEVDTIVLPMLGFDRSGRRIGYGAGYYDRFLEKNPALQKIGIAFACQEYDNLPVDENDIPVDCIITEDGIVYSNGSVIQQRSVKPNVLIPVARRSRYRFSNKLSQPHRNEGIQQV